MAKVALKTGDKDFITIALPYLRQNAGNEIVFWLNPTYATLNHANNPNQLNPGDPGTIFSYTNSELSGVDNVEVVCVGKDTYTQLFSKFTPLQLGTPATTAQAFAAQIYSTVNSGNNNPNPSIITPSTDIPYIILKSRDSSQPSVCSAKSPNARWSIDIIP